MKFILLDTSSQSLSPCHNLFYRFSEYIQHKCHLHGVNSRGWGMSLLGSNHHGHGCPWKLDHLVALDGGCSAHFRVCTGEDGTGDLYNWENVLALQREIYNDSLESTSQDSLKMPGYVDLVVADGGCDAQRDSECQEEVTNQIVLCQVAAGLSLLRKGGMLLLKTFGTRTVIGKLIMRHLFDNFEKIIIVKPVLSRPASAERYVVCVGYDSPSLFRWDALEWRDRLLNDDAFRTSQLQGESNINFEEYLNKIDGEILKLNVKACFGILSVLQKNGENSATCETSNDDNEFLKEMPKKRFVDVYGYKKAWKIGQK